MCKWLMSEAGMISVGDYRDLNYQLCILKQDDTADWSDMQQRFRFAVVNLDRAKEYPLNFVCILPMRLNSKVEKRTEFEKHFGGESLEVAKKLLSDALKSAEGEDVRGEIERRLSLLVPKLASEKPCANCGKTFQTKQKRYIKQKFCEDCLKKKFSSHT